MSNEYFDQLKPCPFCGDIPYITELEDKDDRRYFERSLICCVTMSDSMCWGIYKDMSDAKASKIVGDDLVKMWNQRWEDNE